MFYFVGLCFTVIFWLQSFKKCVYQISLKMFFLNGNVHVRRSGLRRFSYMDRYLHPALYWGKDLWRINVKLVVNWLQPHWTCLKLLSEGLSDQRINCPNDITNITIINKNRDNICGFKFVQIIQQYKCC